MKQDRFLLTYSILSEIWNLTECDNYIYIYIMSKQTPRMGLVKVKRFPVNIWSRRHWKHIKRRHVLKSVDGPWRGEAPLSREEDDSKGNRVLMEPSQDKTEKQTQKWVTDSGWHDRKTRSLAVTTTAFLFKHVSSQNLSPFPSFFSVIPKECL